VGRRAGDRPRERDHGHHDQHVGGRVGGDGADQQQQPEPGEQRVAARDAGGADQQRHSHGQPGQRAAGKQQRHASSGGPAIVEPAERSPRQQAQADRRHQHARKGEPDGPGARSCRKAAEADEERRRAQDDDEQAPVQRTGIAPSPLGQQLPDPEEPQATAEEPQAVGSSAEVPHHHQRQPDAEHQPWEREPQPRVGLRLPVPAELQVQEHRGGEEQDGGDGDQPQPTVRGEEGEQGQDRDVAEHRDDQAPGPAAARHRPRGVGCRRPRSCGAAGGGHDALP
jgi:hypothetical protein